MKKLKAGIQILLVIALMFTLTSCGSKGDDKLLTMVLDQPGIHSVVEYYGKDNLATTQTTKSTLNYKEMGVTDPAAIEAMKSKMEEVSKQYQEIKGITQSMTFTDEGLTENVSVNFKEMDFEKAKGVIGITMDNGDPQKGVDVNASKKILEAQGYVEQK